MFGLSYSDMVENFHLHVMTLFVNASSLHLTLVTFERLMLNIAVYTYGLMITQQTNLSRLYKLYRYGASLRTRCELRFYSH